jgi:hypothetical protein
VSARSNNLKVWRRLALVFLGFAALGAVAGALWMRREPKAEAVAGARAVRVERVDGEVGLSRGLGADAPEDQWLALTPNTPLTEGDRLYAREDSRAALAFTGRNFARLEPSSSLDVVSLSERRTQLALREGSAIFNVGRLEPGELFEVATPYGAVDLQEPGLYEVGYNDDGSAFVSVLSGLAQVVGLAGSGQVSKGEMLTLLGQTAAQVALSRLSPDYAGGLLDDYYGYQYPDAYDGRYQDYNAYLSDPNYYDPYESYESYRYVPERVPGAYDLDRYGEWSSLDGYGNVWSPRVDEGWAPYREGYWALDDPYGLTWVSNEPWGYAPYHYGRWLNADGRWYWAPGDAGAQNSYAPALVAFLPATGANQVGWSPLAPGEPYAPAYYDADWQPRYPDGGQTFFERVLNVNAPGGLTVVSVDDFGRVIDRGALARYDPRAFEGVRPQRDPLSVAALRQASLARAVERRGFTLPPGLAKKLDATQVYASAPPPARPGREDLARRLGVAALPEKQKKQKLNLDDARQPRRQERAQEGRAEKTQGRAARVRDSFPQQQQPGVPLGERVAGRGDERARGERPGHARQEQRQAERQQRAVAERQQRASKMQQAEGRAQARQQAAAQREQQRAAQRAQQQEMMRARPQSQPRGRGGAGPQSQPRAAAAQAPPGQARRQQSPAPQGGGRHAGGPPQGAKQHGGGAGGGNGKGKGKN